MTDRDDISSFEDFAGATAPGGARPVVCVQGLGFVGAAMAVAVAAAVDGTGAPVFDVVGVDLPTEAGLAIIEKLNAGELPFASTDKELAAALERVRRQGNFVATTDERAYGLAEVVVVDVPLDLTNRDGVSAVEFDGLRHAIATLGRFMRPGSLVVVETTVPPGTTERIVGPALGQALEERGLPQDAVLIAHSYERVMPGNGYLDSIINFWRAYAGLTVDAAEACERFLSQIINVAEYPLTRLSSTTACELAKVLENSFRATTIALMEEWSRLAEAIGVDMFEVVDGIRRRPTHANIRQPGFGVGGYCLTKDPLFGEVAARLLYGLPELAFPFSMLAVTVNDRMPLVSVARLERLLEDGLESSAIVLMGVSYRSGIADTRQSPSEVFVRALRDQGAQVVCHDPLVSEWRELGMTISPSLPPVDDVDAVVFAVAHEEYLAIDFEDWFGERRPIVLDANNVLTGEQRAGLRALGCTVASIGRGDS
jgi:UDP-N-acetyl-D-glucosamine dehydrogenase